MSTAPGVLEIVRDAVEGEPYVAAAWLFGSHAAGRATPLSDVDVAVLFAGRERAGEVHGRLMDLLCTNLRTDRVDLVDLGEAPPPLAYRVIRDGLLLCRRDPGAHQRFFARTVMRYLDFKPLRDRMFALSSRRTLGEE